jgi:hypothetical protein
MSVRLRHGALALGSDHRERRSGTHERDRAEGAHRESWRKAGAPSTASVEREPRGNGDAPVQRCPHVQDRVRVLWAARMAAGRRQHRVPRVREPNGCAPIGRDTRHPAYARCAPERNHRRSRPKPDAGRCRGCRCGAGESAGAGGRCHQGGGTGCGDGGRRSSLREFRCSFRHSPVGRPAARWRAVLGP